MSSYSSSSGTEKTDTKLIYDNFFRTVEIILGNRKGTMHPIMNEASLALDGGHQFPGNQEYCDYVIRSQN